METLSILSAIAFPTFAAVALVTGASTGIGAAVAAPWQA
jgi:NADP-dependent 3-hydroxy acid dehydrogenase YdfG